VVLIVDHPAAAVTHDGARLGANHAPHIEDIDTEFRTVG
jgi:hypothetical protein